MKISTAIKPKENQYSNTYKPTREEDYINFYLDKSNIRFNEQFVLRDLKYDTKKHRRVDFYLYNLDVYVEYYGLYNATKETRKEYDEKTQVYFKNSIPTIILYPHELGILDYAFHTKMLKLFELDKFKDRKSKLYRYLFFRYLNKGKWKLFFVSIFWAYLINLFGNDLLDIDEGLNSILFFICFGMVVYYPVMFLMDIIFYIKDNGTFD